MNRSRTAASCPQTTNTKKDAMTLRRRLLIAGAPLLALTLLQPPGSAVAAGGPQQPTGPSRSTAADTAFRASLGAYLHDLQGAATAASTNPHLHHSAGHLKDQQAALALAQAQLAGLNTKQLAAMHALLSRDARWQAGPATVRTAIDSVGAPKLSGPAGAAANPSLVQGAIAGPPPGYLSACTAALGDQQGVFYGYWAAAQVASAANAVASGLPDGVDFTPALIIAGVAFGVANGIAIGLQADLTLGQDCAVGAENATLTSTWPIDPSNPTGHTPASSQISVTTLTSLVGGVKTTLDAVQTTTNDITTKLTNLIASLGTAQGTANSILSTTTDLQGRSDTLLTSVGAPSSTALTDANGLANTINAREDTTLANTAALQALDVRLQVERNLASPPAAVIALFALPASQGGYLELARDITTQMIATMNGQGQPVYNASSQLASGNAAYASKQYEAAYTAYSQAYQSAVK